MRALITGIGGFVGRHLAAHLQACGDDVHGFDRAEGGVDIGDLAAVTERVETVRPEVVYHLAGWSDVGGSWSQPVEAFRANAVGTLNVLLACERAHTRGVVSVSSADVYGIVDEHELPISETAPLRPVSPYAASKAAAEQLAVQAWLGRGLEVVRVRAFNHLGPGQSARFVAAALAERIAKAEASGELVVPVGDLSARRDFTDVRDIVRAYRLLALHGQPGDVYNVCSGTDVAIGDLAEQLVELAAGEIRLARDASLERPVEVPVLRGDGRKMHEVTGWQPEVPIKQTLADVLVEWRERITSNRNDDSPR